MVTNGQITDEEARFLVGDGANTPPGRTPLPTSEGTLAKGQYRRSDIHDLLTAIAVVNDDGTPIGAGAESILSQVATLLQTLTERDTDLGALIAAVEAGPTPSVIEVQEKLFDTGLLEPGGITVASIYTAGDAVGNLMVFEVPKAGTIQTGVYLDKDDEGIETVLFLFNQEIRQVSDHDPFGVSDADLDFLVATITFSTFEDLITSQSSIASGLFETYVAPDGRLWGQMVTRGTPNIAAANLPQFRMSGIVKGLMEVIPNA